MNFWQTLLISLIPAIIAAIISIIVACIQIKSAKKQIKITHNEEKKLYISKTRFDKEFLIYGELSENTLTMVYDNAQLFPAGIDYLPFNKEDKDKVLLERFNKAVKSFNLANAVLHKYAPFIPKNIFIDFEDIYKLCLKQINFYPDFRLGRINQECIKELAKEETQCWKDTSIIFKKIEKLTDKLRDYLESLEVKEEK